jgi:hypothetical protein
MNVNPKFVTERHLTLLDNSLTLLHSLNTTEFYPALNSGFVWEV